MDGLRVFDVSSPGAPVEINTIGQFAGALDVAASGNLLYVADGRKLRILDITAPATPVEITIYQSDTGGSRVDVSGSLVYFGGNSMTVLDVSDPSDPQPIGDLSFTVAPGSPEQIKVVGDMVYLAHYIGGVSIVRGCHALFVDGFESGDTLAWSPTTAQEP